MRFLKSAVVSLIVLGLSVSAVTAGTGTGEKQEKKPAVDTTVINWLPYDTALTVLETENKHLFIDFTASWCGWCKRMDKDTFSDKKVIKTVNEHFIPVRVWGDSDNMLDINGYKISERNLAQAQFGVRGYPAFWFISPEGARIGPLPGYQTPDALIKALDWVKDYMYDTTRVKNEVEDKEDTGKSGE